MEGQAVARRYAKALFELAVPSGQAEEVGANLADLMGLADRSPDLFGVFAHPLISPDRKQAVLEALLRRVGALPLTLRFIAHLARKGRLPALHGIASAYRDLLKAHQRRVRAEVFTARPLPEAEILQIRRRLAEAVRSDVEIEVGIDPALLGGVVVRIGSRVADGSLRNHLRQLGRSLSLS